MLKRVFLGLAGALVLFLAIAATRPSVYHVERERPIAAPPERVFGLLNDLRQFAGVMVLFGSPLERRDPAMQKSFEGPGAGAGQSFSWTGPKAGQGRITIEESIPGQKLRLRLEFVKPMQTTALVVIAVAAAPTGSRVSWTMDGNHNFLGKAFGMFVNLDGLLAGDIEKSLAQLQAAAEKQSPGQN